MEILSVCDMKYTLVYSTVDYSENDSSRERNIVNLINLALCEMANNRVR